MLKVLFFASLFRGSADFEVYFSGIGRQHFRNSHIWQEGKLSLAAELRLGLPPSASRLELLVSAQEKGCGTLDCHACFTGPWPQSLLAVQS